MKKALSIFFGAVMLALLYACTRNEGSVGATEITQPSYHQLARTMNDRMAPFDSVIALQLKAVDEVRRGKCVDDPVDVLQQTGYFYTRVGQYGPGLDYLLEAVDSVTRRPLTEENKSTAAMLYGNLANLYVRMEMQHEALDANRRALDYSEGLHRYYAANLWRMRAAIYQHLALPDSVIRCYDNTDRLSVGDSILSTTALTDRAAYMVLEHPERFSPDELNKVVRQVEKLDYKSPKIKATASLVIGQGLIMRGDTEAGLKIIEDVLESTRQRQDVEMLQYTEKFLLKAYAAAGKDTKLARLFPEYTVLSDTLLNREKINSVVTSGFRFRTKQKDMETQMWKERTTNARKIIILQWLAIILATLLATFFTISILRKLRQTRRSKEVLHRRLMSMLAQQKEVNATIESLNSRIEELNKDIADRNDTENSSKLIAEMPSCLLSDTQEAMFRRDFSQIYPHFITDLRRDFASMTQNDELISMLIYMNYNSDEIALSLGISKQSVNKARYRLRKKLGLDKETDLDTFIRSRKG